MGKTDWTNEQLAAINLRGNLLVAAAAGSGKTAVLVERIIRRIMDDEHPLELDRLLVVTFTKAAAAEMRERVGKALEDVLWHESDKYRAERLLRQLHLLPRANITTLHSFCLELARQNFYQLELDPAFRIADETEAELLRQDVIEDLFDVWYEREDACFQRLVEAFGSDRDDHPLMEQVLKLYNFASSHPRPKEWLQSLAQAYHWEGVEELAQSPWGQAVRQGLKDKISAACDLLTQACKLALRPNGPEQYAGIMENELVSLQVLSEALVTGNWSTVEEAVENVEFGRLPATRGNRSKQGHDEDVPLAENDPVLLREQARKLRDEAKGICKKIKEELFEWPLLEQIPALNRTGDLIEDLAELVLSFSAEYASLKKRRNLVDFNDLEHLALTLLERDDQDSPLALSLQQRFNEVLVDEYQDINPAQERILMRVSGFPNGSMFMVGDVKQSIYRFRMADPSLFLVKYNQWPHWHQEIDRSEEAEPSKLVVDLARNFRSRQEVVDGVNFLFRQLMTEGSAEITYDDKAALQYGASYVNSREGLLTAEGPVEVHLFDPGEMMLTHDEEELADKAATGQVENESIGEDTDYSKNEEDEIQEVLETARLEARSVGQRILQMVEEREFEVFDKKIGNFRPIRYADIVILMRSYSSVAPLYAEELQKIKVPVFADTKSGYFGFSEVETVISLLKVIDNPRQDIPLASVLRSPLVGLNGAELGKLRLVLPHGEFYDALALAVEEQETVKEAENLPEDLKERLLNFWHNLHKWRTFSRRHSLAELLTLLYEETGYLAYVGTLPGGSQRQANLRVLFDRACRFEKTNYRGLFRFLRFLEKFRVQGKDMGSARILGENEDVVRILTVHASKGLEFPVVFVVGLGNAFNKRALSGRLLMHSTLGVGAPAIDVNLNVEYPSFIHQGIKQVLAQESVAEEMRILYVALTRAKEKLLLYGSAKKLAAKMEKWGDLAAFASENGFTDSQLRSARSFLDWIIPALLRRDQVLFDHHSRWEIKLNEVSLEEIINISEEKVKTKTGVDSSVDEGKQEIVKGLANGNNLPEEDLMHEVECRLNWEYPFMAEVRQIGKTSVSELKRRLLWYEDENAGLKSWSDGMGKSSSLKIMRPKFLQTGIQDLSAAEKGTALHIVMQQLPLKELAELWNEFSEARRKQWLKDFLARLEENEIITEQQRTAVPEQRILEMLEAPIGGRLLGAEKVLKEVPFTLSLKLPDLKQPVLVQGIIDALIFNSDGIEVLDYKTDQYYSGEETPAAILRKRYALQLGIYALATETLLKEKVARCTIYALNLGLEVRLNANELDEKVQELGIFLSR